MAKKPGRSADKAKKRIADLMRQLEQEQKKTEVAKQETEAARQEVEAVKAQLAEAAQTAKAQLTEAEQAAEEARADLKQENIQLLDRLQEAEQCAKQAGLALDDALERAQVAEQLAEELRARERQLATNQGDLAARRNFYSLDDGERYQCLRLVRTLEKIAAPLDRYDKEDFCELLNWFLGYYQELQEGVYNYGARDPIEVGYQLAKLQVALREEKARQEAEADTSDGAAHDGFETAPDGTPIAELLAEREALMEEWHQAFDPMVQPEQWGSFYTEAIRLFELCNRLNLASDDYPVDPVELLPFELGQRLYWLNERARERQWEEARAIGCLGWFR